MRESKERREEEAKLLKPDSHRNLKGYLDFFRKFKTGAKTYLCKRLSEVNIKV